MPRKKQKTSSQTPSPQKTNSKIYSDDTFARRFAGVHKKQLSAVKVWQSKQRDKLSRSSLGLDFTILGPDSTKWFTSTRLATTLSKLMRDVYLSTEPPTKEISLANYDPLFIDAMVEMLQFDRYTLVPPYQYKLLYNKDNLNQHPNTNDRTPLVFLHLGVYSLGKDIGYEELCDCALYNMQQCLLFKPLDINSFIELKNQVWAKKIDLPDRDHQYEHLNHEELAVRRLLATYAAQMDPVWKKQYRKLWLSQISTSGPYNDFAFWYKKAGEDMKKINKMPKMVECYLGVGDTEDETMQSSSDTADEGSSKDKDGK